MVTKMLFEFLHVANSWPARCAAKNRVNELLGLDHASFVIFPLLVPLKHRELNTPTLPHFLNVAEDRSERINLFEPSPE